MSKYHTDLQAARWLNARTGALLRAGYRSELSGRAGRLEVHHIVPLEAGGAPYALGNLQVLTKAEHIELHQKEHDIPGRAEWRALVREIQTTNEEVIA